jgi:hypothetical protein
VLSRKAPTDGVRYYLHHGVRLASSFLANLHHRQAQSTQFEYRLKLSVSNSELVKDTNTNIAVVQSKTSHKIPYILDEEKVTTQIIPNMRGRVLNISNAVANRKIYLIWVKQIDKRQWHLV